ncbi:MAG: ATP-binding protein [Geminicoccaceae bacterium]
MLNRLKRVWPKGLAGRLILMLLAALVASQAVTAFVFYDARRAAMVDAAREEFLARTTSVVRVLSGAAPEDRMRVARSASSSLLRFRVGTEPIVDEAGGSDHGIVERLRDMLGSSVGEIRVRFGPPLMLHSRLERWQEPDEERPEPAKPPEPGLQPPRRLLISIHLPDGAWVNAVAVPLPRPVVVALPGLVSLVAAALLMGLVVVLSVRRLNRPLLALADAADRLGRGDAVEPLAEAGPDEVRRTTRAFNAMQTRLHSFVEDRTRLLAALGHDLRTPITALRLRAELLDDDDARERMLSTLDEMTAMTEATLAYARDTSRDEPTRSVDLGALVESVTADLGEMGMAVAVAEVRRCVYPCRTLALTRALRNLIENAVRYGGNARIGLKAAADGIDITVDDDGPGIPEADLERVFEPFYRREQSRSRETGGTGLGLAIARSIARSHGGDVTLANREGGGLRATLHLPRVREGSAPVPNPQASA